MSILEQLSSQVGDRTEHSNLDVAEQCLLEPRLIPEIAEGLTRQDPALVGDCAEVLTKIAEENPQLVAPHAQALAALLTHTNTRVRWEAMHALAAMAPLIPEVLAGRLPQLAELLDHDPSVIVRDYAIDAVGTYAQTSTSAALAAYPILVKSLTLAEGKHAAHALNGLRQAAAAAPTLREEIMAMGLRYRDHERGVIRKAARALLKALED